jgi:hypothetical protein
VIVNVPTLAGQTSYQYVMNTITGAWCRFTGWNAQCWALFNDKLFFGAPGGRGLPGRRRPERQRREHRRQRLQAFNDFGSTSQKQFTAMRPVLNANTASRRPARSTSTSTPRRRPRSPRARLDQPMGQPWGSPWSTTNGTMRVWQGAGGVGYAGAPHMVVSLKNGLCQWQSTDVMFQDCSRRYERDPVRRFAGREAVDGRPASARSRRSARTARLSWCATARSAARSGWRTTTAPAR